MSWWSDELTSLATAAQEEPEDILSPSGVVEICDDQDAPLVMLTNNEASQPIFEALNVDLGFVWPARHTHRPLSDEQKQKLRAILRWLIGGLRGWQNTCDPKHSMLAALLATAARLDDDGALWCVLPDAIGENLELGESVARILANVHIDLSIGFSRAPICETEHLAAIVKAEAEKDWPTLREVAEGLHHSFLTSTLVGQSIRLLRRCFPKTLVRYGRSIAGIAIAMQIVNQLSVEEAFNLGAASENDFLQFAAVCRVLNRYVRHQKLSPTEEVALSTMLIKVAAEPTRWESWMDAFASHPYRARQIQSAIGRCLAAASEGAAIAYLHALVLQPNFLGREEVGMCLLAFARQSPLERRKSLWQTAFDRWSTWNYGEAIGERAGNEISVCNLDFAIVGYAIECQTPEERNAFSACCLDTVGRAEHKWHQTQDEFIKCIYRALSRIQPFEHAQHATVDPTTWLWSPNGGYLVHLLNTPYWWNRYQLNKYADATTKAKVSPT